LLTDYELNASLLSEVSIQEEAGNKRQEYSSVGWDPIISRKLSGYNPDIKEELSQLDEAKQEIANAQDAVKERLQSLKEERIRLQKDRERNFAEVERLKTALSDKEKNQESSAASERANTPDSVRSRDGGQNSPRGSQMTANNPASKAPDMPATTAEGDKR
jgi:chromosome segregation ATPase